MPETGHFALDQTGLKKANRSKERGAKSLAYVRGTDMAAGLPA
jgi:hypothetical protein